MKIKNIVNNAIKQLARAFYVNETKILSIQLDATNVIIAQLINIQQLMRVTMSQLAWNNVQVLNF